MIFDLRLWNNNLKIIAMKTNNYNLKELNIQQMTEIYGGSFFSDLWNDIKDWFYGKVKEMYPILP